MASITKDNIPHFRQAIQVGEDITGIMKLPCVIECLKRDIYRHKHVIEYYYTLDPFKMAAGGWQFAHVGDWLCEDEHGKWHLLTADAYRQSQAVPKSSTGLLPT